MQIGDASHPVSNCDHHLGTDASEHWEGFFMTSRPTLLISFTLQYMEGLAEQFTG